MQTVLEQMLGHYKTDTTEEKKNALKEVVQEVALCGLSRAGFFKHAAFYGGTDLRLGKPVLQRRARWRWRRGRLGAVIDGEREELPA